MFIVDTMHNTIKWGSPLLSSTPRDVQDDFYDQIVDEFMVKVLQLYLRVKTELQLSQAQCTPLLFQIRGHTTRTWLQASKLWINCLSTSIRPPHLPLRLSNQTTTDSSELTTHEGLHINRTEARVCSYISTNYHHHHLCVGRYINVT